MERARSRVPEKEAWLAQKLALRWESSWVASLDEATAVAMALEMAAKSALV